MSRRRAPIPVILGAAAAGVVLGHAVSYALAAPHGTARQELLRHTGHGYLGTATLLAVLAAFLVVVAVAVLGFRRGRTAPPASPGRGGRGDGPRGLRLRAAAGLAALQSAGFAALEIAERVTVGAPLSTLTPRFLVAGLTVQVLVGVLVAALLAGVRRLGEAVGRALARPRVPGRSPRRVAPAVRWARPSATVAVRGPRAPPAPLLA